MYCINAAEASAGGQVAKLLCTFYPLLLLRIFAELYLFFQRSDSLNVMWFLV